MSRTFRRNYRNEIVQDKDIVDVHTKKNLKKSTKKLMKLKMIDAWEIPNNDKFGRKV